MYLYGCVSVLALKCAVCQCVCVSTLSNQGTSKKSNVSDLSKLEALLHKTHIKILLVPRFDMCGSIISLSKIAHQMWRDHLFGQRNKTTERAVSVGGWTEF